MNNPLPAPSLHPATQHLLLSVAAIGTGVLLPTLLSEAMTGAALLAGAAGAVGGLGQNLFSGIIQRLFTRRENDPTRPDLNRDLEVRLLGDAIVEELTKFSATLAPAAQSKCRAFAGKIAPAFDELMRGNELPDLTPPDFMHLLAAAAQEQEIPPVGTVNEWLQIVGRLHSKCNGDLHIDTLKEIAVWLHRHLWTSIHSRLKSDFATDGRAYAALQLSFMGTVLHGIDHLTKEAQLTNAQLTELRAIKEQQADPKAALLATLAQDNAALATQFTFYFMQLNGHLDEQFGKLEATNQRRHEETQQSLQRIETKLDARDDAVVDKLLARISEEAQEKGRLRAELEAALQRLATAEAKGNVSAGDTLKQLRKDGDPKPLGAFLDQQLAEKQTDIVALLRERLAVAYVTGEIERAEQCAQQILATVANDLDAINRLGHIYKLRGDLPTAEKQYRRLLELAPDDEETKSVALGNLGLIYRTQGKLAEAEQFLRAALALHQQLNSLEGQAVGLGNLGLIYRTQGKLAEAEQFHCDALAITEQLGSLEEQASALGDLGLIYRIQGKLAEAEQFYRQSLAINEKLGRLGGQAIQLANLGLIAKDRGHLAEARRLWTEARELYARVGMAPDVAQVEAWLAELKENEE